MSTCITADRKTDLESDLAAVLANITAIDAAILAVSLGGTKSYSFDSGTGRAQEVFNNPMEMIKVRSSLIADRNYYRLALAGKTILRQQTRR